MLVGAHTLPKLPRHKHITYTYGLIRISLTFRMVCNYKREIERASISEESMQAALADVLENILSFREAALQERIKKARIAEKLLIQAWKTVMMTKTSKYATRKFAQED